MKTKAEATIEDLYRVPGKAEIVNGEIVHMPPTGFQPSRAGGRIYASLLNYELKVEHGYAMTDGVGYVVDLPNRKSFSPDASFYIGEVPPDRKMKFVQGVPMFAVEVRSENDYGPAAEKEMAAKRADYYAAGTDVVWDVDLRGSDAVVRAYHRDNPDSPTIFRRGEFADVEPVLPGWKMPVDDLFL
ncbi:MAG: Uma2 family endonuclease [Chloroflexia bacterium]